MKTMMFVPTERRFKLRVSLPFLTREACLRIKREFEAEFSTVELCVEELTTAEAYTLKRHDSRCVGARLAQHELDGGLHVVQADALLLPELRRQELIRALRSAPDPSDWHRAALEAVTVNGEFFASPHLQCAMFLYWHLTEYSSVRNLAELHAALGKSMAPIGLAGRVGSWNLAALYLDFCAAQHGSDRVIDGEKTDPDESAILQLKDFIGSLTPGFASAYSNQETSPAYQFANGWADAMIGYSEDFRDILLLASGQREIFFTASPWGDKDRPFLFTDALFLRKDCSEICERIARTFMQYLLRRETMNWLLMGKEMADARVPHYYLPATKSGYTPTVLSDRYYCDFERLTRNGRPYPNSLYGLRHSILERLPELSAIPKKPVGREENELKIKVA